MSSYWKALTMAGAGIDVYGPELQNTLRSQKLQDCQKSKLKKQKTKLRMLGENWESLQVIAFSVNSKFQQYAGLLSTLIMQTNSAIVLTSLGFQSAGLLCDFKMSS